MGRKDRGGNSNKSKNKEVGKFGGLISLTCNYLNSQSVYHITHAYFSILKFGKCLLRLFKLTSKVQNSFEVLSLGCYRKSIGFWSENGFKCSL